MTVPVGWILSDERNAPKKRRRKGKSQAKSKKSSLLETEQHSDLNGIPDSIVEDIPVDDAPMPIDVSEVEELVSEPLKTPICRLFLIALFPSHRLMKGFKVLFGTILLR